MTKIDDIFDRLQKEQPVIDMPDELTESIMNSLPDRKAEATGGQKAKKAWLFTAIGAVAASVVLLLTFHHLSTEEGERQPTMVAQHTDADSEKLLPPPDTKEETPALRQVSVAANSQKQLAQERTMLKGNPHPQTALVHETVGASKRAHTPTAEKTVRKAGREFTDTLGNGIWEHKENVIRAVSILAECEATIAREHQQVRNEIIKTTFYATPQASDAILVTNEAGDYEVMRLNNITDL